MDLIHFLLAFFLFYFVLVKIFNKKSSLKLPPGPWALPIIGNLYQLTKGGLMHHVLRDIAKKYGPLIHLKFGQVSAIVVSSPEVAMEIFKTRDIIFSERSTDTEAVKIASYNCSDILFSPYSNYWRQMRKICTVELLGSRRAKAFRSVRQNEVLNMIRSIHSQEGKVVNLSEMFSLFSYGVTARSAFGNANRYEEGLGMKLDRLDEYIEGFNIEDLYPSLKFLQFFTRMERKLKVIFNEIDETLQKIIDDHKDKEEMMKQKLDQGGEANQDLVDVFLKLQKEGDFEFPLTDNCIKGIILDMFGGGGSTSAATLEWAISEAIKNPRILKRAQDEVRNAFHDKGNVDESNIDELKYSQALIKETLRLHSPLPLSVPRTCKEKCTVYGYDIPAKTRLLVNLWAIGRDPKYWNEPEKFDPERFLDSSIDYKGSNFEYIPFGAGRRICPGISFAFSNIAIALSQLLFHFDWEVPDGMKLEDLDMVEDPGVTAKRKNELKLTPATYYRSRLKESLS